MDAETLLNRYALAFEKYGCEDAPVSMLRWLRLAEQWQYEECQRLAAVIEKELVERAVNLFEYRLGYNANDPAQIKLDTYHRVRNVISTALVIEAVAESDEI